eukprot:UN28167
MNPPEVNAYYSPSRNEIVFPAGILQPHFFHHDTLSSINYGAIGAVMGHELTHGFDDQGRKYDAYGNLTPWWSDATGEKFEDETQCMIKQYDSFTVETSQGTEHVNGKTTLGENYC